MIRHQHCPVCGKIAVEVSRAKFLSVYRVTLKCGHVVNQETLKTSEFTYEDVLSLKNDKPKEFQLKTGHWLDNNNARGLVAHEMGLGKTVCSLMPLKVHPNMLPAIVVTKSSPKWQWFKESINWCGQDYMPQVIESAKDMIFPGMKIYIISFDLVKKLLDKLIALNPKTLIIDECQHIKNHTSQRSVAIKTLSQNCKHVIGLSGTPIKNHAGEYFSILNIIDPVRFPGYEHFLHNWVSFIPTESGHEKPHSIRYPERWQEFTKDIILRYEWSDVYTEYPEIVRDFQYQDIDTDLKKAYEKEESRFIEFYKDIALEGRSMSFGEYTDLLAFFARMRHLTGLGKVEWTVDRVSEFLLSTDEKIVIFTHHNDVMDAVYNMLCEWCRDGGFQYPLKLHSGLSSAEREEVVDAFKKDGNRILVASTLAAGEALNLQFCSNAILMERQWNPANEEQAEGRFKRIGQLAKNIKVVYPIVLGTIDEYFTELVEQKRAMFRETMTGEEIQWDEQSNVVALADAIMTKRGGRKWSY